MKQEKREVNVDIELYRFIYSKSSFATCSFINLGKEREVSTAQGYKELKVKTSLNCLNIKLVVLEFISFTTIVRKMSKLHVFTLW